MMLSPQQYVYNQVASYPSLYHANSYEAAAKRVFDRLFNVIRNGVDLPDELDRPIVQKKLKHGGNCMHRFVVC